MFTEGQRVKKIGNRGSEKIVTIIKVTPKGFVRIDSDPEKLIRPDGSWSGGCSGNSTMALFRASENWFAIEPIS